MYVYKYIYTYVIVFQNVISIETKYVQHLCHMLSKDVQKFLVIVSYRIVFELNVETNIEKFLF